MKTREREEVNFRILENMCNLPVPINSYFEREREESREFMDFARYQRRRISNLGYRVVSFRVVLGENRVWYVEKNRVWVGRVVKNKSRGGSCSVFNQISLEGYYDNDRTYAS